MKRNTASGFTLSELLVTIVILGVLSAIGVGSILTELRTVRVESAANELAGWLGAVRRSSERGIGCRVDVPNTNPVSVVTNVATASALNPDNTLNNTLPNNCLSADPLRFTSGQGSGVATTYAVTSPVNQFVFTPRGTICDADVNLSCTLVNPIEITISAVEGGAIVGNPRRVCIRPPLGLIEVAAACS